MQTHSKYCKVTEQRQRMDLSRRLLTKNVTTRAAVRHLPVRRVHQTAGAVHSWQSAAPHILTLSSHYNCSCCDVTSGRRELHHVSLSKFCNTSQFAMHTTWLAVPSSSYRYPNNIWQSVPIKQLISRSLAILSFLLCSALSTVFWQQACQFVLQHCKDRHDTSSDPTHERFYRINFNPIRPSCYFMYRRV
jgi:hypothetical protein